MPRCRPADCYEKIHKIGQGTFGEVFKAKSKETGKFVALKKVVMENEKEGFPITALREIKILQALHHENVVDLIEVCRSTPTNLNRNGSIFLVLEFCQHDLAGLLSNKTIKFSLGEIKKIMYQLLEGLFYMHRNKVIHRDMKAANVLITKDGTLKLADFGLARAFTVHKEGESNRYTNRVVTLWYRPPELLLGERNYGPPIDIWGAGCILCELWTRVPLMQGNEEKNQLDLITNLCGSITPDVWPGVEKLQHYQHYIVNDKKQHNRKRILKQRLMQKIRDRHGLDLIDKLLCLDPKKRLDADEALNHDFMWNEPLPSDKLKCLETLKEHNFEYLQQNHQKQKAAKQHQLNNRHHPYNNHHHQRNNNKQKEEDSSMKYQDRIW